MKKMLAVALLLVFSTSSVFAADAPAKKSPKKSVDQCDDHAVYHGGGYGMMGGYGGMGGYGMGGQGMMMGAGIYGMLNLSADQQEKIGKISDQINHDNWARQGTINDEAAKLRDLYEADKRDPVAIGEEYKKIFDLKRQMIEAYLTAQNQMDAILTPEQQAQMKDLRRNHMYMHPRP